MEAIDREYYQGVIAELREAIDMARNRLEIALLPPEEEPCRHCVEVALSYLADSNGDRK